MRGFPMRYQLYKLFNFLVSVIPRPILWRMLNTLHRHPETADRVGYQVYPQGFYNPFPTPGEVDIAKLNSPRSLPKVHPHVAESLQLVQELSRFAGEVESYLKNRPGNLARWDESYPQLDSA